MFESFGKVNYCQHTKVDGFAEHLQAGRLMGSSCAACGQFSFPPRADCPTCRHDEFNFNELDGQGTVVTYTTIGAAPAGFEDEAPFVLGVIDLAEGGRLLAKFGESINPEEININMEVQVVPNTRKENKSVKVSYTLEKPGTTWNNSAT